jgi:arylsulfatase A-like enzyme
VRYPAKVKAGRRSDALFTQVDFAPTLLSLCGVKPPASMQGADLSRVITGEVADGPESAFFQIFGPFHGDRTEGAWRGVRTKRYMYARFEEKPWVLYDLRTDPYEMTNLAGKPEAEKIQKDMDAKLAAWMKKTGDSWKYDWTEPVEDAGRLYKHATFYSVDEYLKWAKEHPEVAK